MDAIKKQLFGLCSFMLIFLGDRELSKKIAWRPLRNFLKKV